jgi:nucleoside-diphosphate-sugar epimerase
MVRRMRIFVTGASGFIGSAVVRELLRAGHRVLGLARSDTAAAAITAAGAEVHRGELADPASLGAGAAACDGVIHLGFIHDFRDFTQYAASCETDRRVIEALGAALAGSDRPLLIASGTALPATAGPVTEADRAGAGPQAIPRVATEHAADALAARGIRAGLVRFPPTVHGAGDRGFVPMIIDLARKTGVAAWIGANRWPAVHRRDAADLCRRAVEHAFEPGTRFHAVAEEGIAFRAIAELVARRLALPAEPRPAEHFGWFAHFAALDRPASSARTRAVLGWQPDGPGLLADLDAAYF